MYRPIAYFITGVFFILLGVFQFVQRQRIGIDDFVLLTGHLRAKVEIKRSSFKGNNTDYLVIKIYEFPQGEFHTYNKDVIANKQFLFQNMYSDFKQWSEDSVKFHLLKDRFGGAVDAEEIYSLSNYKRNFFDLRSEMVGEYLPAGTGFFLDIGLTLGSIFIWVSIVKYSRIVIKHRKVNN